MDINSQKGMRFCLCTKINAESYFAVYVRIFHFYLLNCGWSLKVARVVQGIHDNVESFIHVKIPYLLSDEGFARLFSFSTPQSVCTSFSSNPLLWYFFWTMSEWKNGHWINAGGVWEKKRETFYRKFLMMNRESLLGMKKINNFMIDDQLPFFRCFMMV